METFKSTCTELNKILEIREEFIGKINEIIYKEVFQKGGSLYWSRELFIDCETSDELCRKMINTNKVMFVPTDDPIEHLGITLTYKPEFSKEQYGDNKSRSICFA